MKPTVVPFASLTAALLACVASALPARADSAYAGTAQGSLTIDGKPIPMPYAYAISVDDVEEAGLQISGPEKYDVFVFSSAALPQISVANRNSPYGDRRSFAQLFQPLTPSPVEKAYAIVIKLDPVKLKTLSAQFIFPGSSGGLTFEGQDYPDRVTGLTVASGSVSGTAFVPTTQSTGADKGPQKYIYHLTFTAPLLTEAPVDSNLEGKAALASPQVAVLRAYATAAHKGDLATLKSLTAQDHLVYLKDPDFVKSMRQMNPAMILSQVKRVVVRGNTATIMAVSTQPNYSQTAVNMTEENGTWKLCMP